MRKNYLDPELCAVCGGKCCKLMAGGTIPSDITHIFGGPLETALLTAFQSGMWVIDWWEGDPRDEPTEGRLDRGYYVRPRVIGDRTGILNPSWGGTCIFLSSSGCQLPPEDRPASCRLLEPKAGGCIMHDNGGKREAALAWLGYHKLLLDIKDDCANSAADCPRFCQVRLTGA